MSRSVTRHRREDLAPTAEELLAMRRRFEVLAGDVNAITIGGFPCQIFDRRDIREAFEHLVVFGGLTRRTYVRTYYDPAALAKLLVVPA